MKRKIFLFIFIVFILLSSILSLWMFRAPKPHKKEGKDKFSTERAFKHIEQIAQYPHSMATEEHKKVRNYIYNELKKIGLKTSIQSTTSIFDFRGEVSAGSIHNIIGVLKGKKGEKSILVSAHYDSQPNTPGASDDGVAVAAILESARAISNDTVLNNDVIFLISDGEEAGLFGAKAFAEQHPLMQNVGLVLNLEARGTSGPSFTFETSPENGWIMREYAKAVHYPITSSLAYEVYKMMPNNSDFTIYKNLGYSGLNTAFIGSYVNYHSMLDNPSNVSKRSLYHQGSYIMDIVKHFGNLNLKQTKADDLIFFNCLGYLLIWYPQKWNTVFIIIITLLFISIIYFGIKKKKINMWKSLLGFLIFCVILGLSLGGVHLIQKGIRSYYSWYENFHDANFYNISYYFFALAAFCLTIVSSIYALLYKKIKMLNLWIGAIFFHLILSYFVLIYIPTGFFISLIPLLFLQLFIIIQFLLDLKFAEKSYLLLFAILVFPVISMFLPYIKILYITFGLETVIAGSIFWMLLLSFFLPVFEVIFSLKRWLLSIVSFILIIGFLFIAHLNSNYNEKRPLQSNVIYCQNTQTNQSHWVSNIQYIDQWNKQFFTNPKLEPLTEIYPNASQLCLINGAPFSAIPHPQLTIQNDLITDNTRCVKINVHSQQQAENAEFYFHKNAEIVELKINGHILNNTDFYNISMNNDYHHLNFYGMSEQGVNFEIKCKAGNQIDMIMIEKKLGLPDFKEYTKMPAYIIPKTDYDSNVTVLRKNWKF